MFSLGEEADRPVAMVPLRFGLGWCSLRAGRWRPRHPFFTAARNRKVTAVSGQVGGFRRGRALDEGVDNGIDRQEACRNSGCEGGSRE